MHYLKMLLWRNAVKVWWDSPKQQMFKLEPFSKWSITKHARTAKQLFAYLGLQELRRSELSNNTWLITYLENFYSCTWHWKRTQVLKPQSNAHPLAHDDYASTCTPQFNPRVWKISILSLRHCIYNWLHLSINTSWKNMI